MNIFFPHTLKKKPKSEPSNKSLEKFRHIAEVSIPIFTSLLSKADAKYCDSAKISFTLTLQSVTCRTPWRSSATALKADSFRLFGVYDSESRNCTQQLSCEPACCEPSDSNVSKAEAKYYINNACLLALTFWTIAYCKQRQSIVRALRDRLFRFFEFYRVKN